MHSVVWGLLVPKLEQSDLPAARLVCRDLAAAVDGSGAITSFRVGSKGWDVLHAPLSLQHSITSLTATISSAHDWTMMQQFLEQLLQCSKLCCTGRRTWPPQLPAGSASTAPHPKLQAISFPEGLLTSLTTLSALAPNLHSLSCHTLVLRSMGTSNPHETAGAHNITYTNGSNSSRVLNGTGSLPTCTAFAAEAVSIAAGDEMEAGQAFAAALPRLKVLWDTPTFAWAVPAGSRMRYSVLPLHKALSCCSSLTRLRTFGSSTAMGGLLPVQLASLQQLQHLSVYGVGPAVELLGMSNLTQLTALSLTFELPDKRSGWKLVQQLGSLPRLQRLAVPAKLLCGKCCLGAREQLQDLLLAPHTGSSNSPPGSSAGKQHDNSSQGSRRCFQHLSQLTFLCRAKADHRRYQCGDFCKHHSPQELQDVACQLAGVVQGVTARPPNIAMCLGPSAALPAAQVPTAVAAAGAAGGLVDLTTQVTASHTSHKQASLGQQYQQQQQPGDGVRAGWLTVGFALLSCQPERTQQGVALVAGCVGDAVVGAPGDAEWWW